METICGTIHNSRNDNQIQIDFVAIINCVKVNLENETNLNFADALEDGVFVFVA